MRAVLLVGISGCGKSTFTSTLFGKDDPDWRIISSDVFRKQLVSYDKTKSFWTQYRFDKQIEKEVKRLTEEAISEAALLGINIVLDNTHLNPNTLKHNIELCESVGYKTEVINLNPTLDINFYLKRNKGRQDELNSQVINDQYVMAFKNNPETFQEQFKQDTKPVVTIVDIDGTVAQMHNRTPFQYTHVLNDLPRTHVINVIKALYETKRVDKIIFLSGRESVCYEDTMQWLVNQGFEQHTFNLFMRVKRDARKDWIIKDEIYKSCIKPFYDVQYVFDDRNQMIDYWLDEKLPVFNVGDYRNEF